MTAADLRDPEIRARSGRGVSRAISGHELVGSVTSPWLLAHLSSWVCWFSAGRPQGGAPELLDGLVRRSALGGLPRRAQVLGREPTTGLPPLAACRLWRARSYGRPADTGRACSTSARSSSNRGQTASAGVFRRGHTRARETGSVLTGVHQVTLLVVPAAFVPTESAGMVLAAVLFKGAAVLVGAAVGRAGFDPVSSPAQSRPARKSWLIAGGVCHLARAASDPAAARAGPGYRCRIPASG